MRLYRRSFSAYFERAELVMRVTILTEGDSEYKALPLLADQVRSACDLDAFKVLKVPVTPDAPAGVVGRQCADRAKVAMFDGADAVIVVLDREAQDGCCGTIAATITEAMLRHCQHLSQVTLSVVLKDRKFENWLIADLEALKSQPARYKVPASLTRLVVPDKADKLDAERLLKQAVIGGQYEKKKDAERICKRVDIERLAAHSRSFRHFLHALGHRQYKDQCKAPATAIPAQIRRVANQSTKATGRRAYT